MRPLEMAVVGFVLSFVLVHLWRASHPRALRRRTVVSAAIAVAALSAVVAHVLIDGARWQMAGPYGAVIVVLVTAVARVATSLRDGSRPRTGSAAWWFVRRAAGVVAVAGLLGASLVPAVALPVPPLPPPTGPYAVGTDSIEYVVAAGSDEERRARARLWYPAAGSTSGSTARLDGESGTRAAAQRPRASTNWLEHVDVMLPELAVRAGLPRWSLAHLRHTRTYSAWGVPAAEGRFGIVTFSHGRAGFAAQNTFYAEELASHGWIVVAPEHPGGAVLSVFRDGTVVPYDPATFGEGLTGPAYDAVIRELGRRWTADTLAAVDAATGPTAPAALRGRIDRSRLVTSGHSTGGGSAFLTCATAPTCIGAIGLDPWMLPTPPALWRDEGAPGVPAPVLGMFSDPALGFFEPSNHEAFELLARVTRASGYEVVDRTLAGAGHMDFADVTLLSPYAAAIGLDVGPAPSGEVLPAIREQVVRWLDALP